jgi:hypothetical protein
MRNFTFELNRDGVRELLIGAEMQALLQEKADAIAARAGAGYEAEVYMAQTRAVATVATDTAEAARDNAANNTLLGALL